MNASIHKQVVGSVGLVEMNNPTLRDINTVQIPKCSKILSIGNQRENLCVWYVIEDIDEKEFIDVEFHVFGTGNPFNLPKGGTFVYAGTVQFLDGDLVFHVFIKKEPKTDSILTRFGV